MNIRVFTVQLHIWLYVQDSREFICGTLNFIQLIIHIKLNCFLLIPATFLPTTISECAKNNVYAQICNKYNTHISRF